MINPYRATNILLFSLVFVVLGAHNLYAQTTHTWTGEGDGESWEDAANWDANSVPGLTDEAVINMMDGAFYRIIVGEASVGSLTLASTRTTLEIMGGMIVSESLTFDGGTIDGAGILSVEGDFTWSQGNMYGTGSTILLGRSVVANPSFRGLPIDQRRIEIHDELVFEQGELSPRRGATIIVEEGAVVEFGESSTGFNPNGGNPASRLVNHGLLVKREGQQSSATIGMTNQLGGPMIFENYGEVKNEAGRMSIYLPEGSVNAGKVVANWSSITFHNAAGHNAEAVELGGLIRGTGSFTFMYAIDVTGEIDVEGSLYSRDGTTFTEQLTLTRAGSIFVETNNFTEHVFALRRPGETRIGALHVNGRFDLQGDLVIENAFGVGLGNRAEITGSGSITVEPGGATALGYGSIEGLSAIRAQQVFSLPAIVLEGDFPAAHSSVTLRGTDLFIEGDVEWDDGALILTDGASVEIGENVAFDIQRDGRFILGDDATGTERIVNNGTIRKSGVGRIERLEWGMDEPEYDNDSHGTEIGVPFVNAGALSLEAGRTVVSNAFEHHGLIQGTDTLDVTDAAFKVAGGIIAPGAPVGTLTVRGPIDLTDQRLEIEIAGRPADEAHDVLHVLGELTLGGSVDVVFLDHQPEPGDQYRIANVTGMMSGTFAELTLPDIPGVELDIHADDGVVFLLVEASDAAPPVLAVEPLEIGFPETTMGDSTTQSVTIANEGKTDLLISALFVDAADSPFTVAASDEVVAPGERIEVDVFFAPLAAGSYEATLVIRTNGGNADIRLTGSAIEPDVPQPILAVDQEAVVFPETESGETSTHELTISNDGEAELTIASIELDDDSAPFSWEAFSPTLGAGESRTFDLTFAPEKPGSFEATLTISTNGGSAEVNLAGTSPEIETPLPVAVDDHATTQRGEPVMIDVLANDYDPNGLRLTIVDVEKPARGSATTDGATITYTPDAGFAGTDRFAYVVENEDGLQARATVTVNVVAFSFTITDLSPLSDAPAKAVAVSPEGVVAGITLTSRGITPFLWMGGASEVVDVPGGAAVTPYAVDDRGMMAGVSVAGDSISRAVVVDARGTLKPLGDLGGRFGVAFDMNENGTIVGAAGAPQGLVKAFTWNGEMRVIDFLSGGHSEAFAVNDREGVTGAVTAPDGVSYAVVNGRMVAEAATRAYDINNMGMSVGSALVDGRVVVRAWDRDGEVLPVDVNGVPFSEAYAVSDGGWIVGTAGSDASSKSAGKHAESHEQALARWMSGPRRSLQDGLTLSSAGKTAADASLHAMLWSEGEAFNLNDLIYEADAEWHLIEARDVNAAGQIVGYGLKDGRPAAFLLTPTDVDRPRVLKVARDVHGPAPLTIRVDEIAEDRTGSTLKLLGAETPAFGTLEIAADGMQLVYTPSGATAAVDSFRVYVGNGNGIAVNASVTINLLPDAYADGSVRLHPNYPNPFSRTTNVVFSLPEAGPVRITLFDLLGREVRIVLDDELPAGQHDLPFAAHDLASGPYLLHIDSDVGSDTRLVNAVR